MIRLLLCLAALAAARADDAVLSRHARMAGGTVVSDLSYPFIVGIQPRRSQAGATVNLAPCTGVLIEGSINSNISPAPTTNYYVLTSATCAQSGTTLDLYAGVTRILPTSTATQAGVESSTAIINREYFNDPNRGDLAIIPTTIVAGNSADGVITAARLISVDDSTRGFTASSVNMAGWGYPNSNFQGASPSLRSVSARIVPNFYCTLANLGKTITSNHVCTGGLINRGPCTGDSGAPLVIQRNNQARILGLATMVPRQGCSTGRPGIFTHLGPYLSWIQSTAFYDPED